MSFTVISPRPIRFTSTYALDLGASNPTQGNLRVRTMDNAGNTIGEVTKAPAYEPGFQSSDDLILGMAQRIQEAQATNRDKLGKDDAIRGVAIFAPGQANMEGLVRRFSNLRTVTGQPLENINFKDLWSKLRSLNLPTASQAAFKRFVGNDMMGGIAEALRQLAQKCPQFIRPGQSIVYIATGGGCGVAYAEVAEDGQIRLKSSEAGNMYDPTQNTSVEDAGACTSALLSNFLSQLQLSAEQKQKILNANRGEVVTRFADAKAALPNFNATDYARAADFATGRYIDSLAQIAEVKILDGVNLAVLSGPTLSGVKAYVNQNPGHFASELQYYEENVPKYATPDTFEKVFLSRVWKRLTPPGQSQFEQHQFTVLTNIQVPDNTAGARFILQGTLDGRPDRLLLHSGIFGK